MFGICSDRAAGSIMITVMKTRVFRLQVKQLQRAAACTVKVYVMSSHAVAEELIWDLLLRKTLQKQFSTAASHESVIYSAEAQVCLLVYSQCA